MNRILSALAVAAVAAFALPAHAAGSASKTFTVTAVVADNCTIDAANITFASSYDPVVANLAAPLDGAGSVTIACTVGAVPKISLDDGLQPAGGSRYMTKGSGADLKYDLFSDNLYSSRWGSAVGQIVLPGAATSTGAQTFPVYARIPGNQQTVAAGTFVDTVKATVNF